MQRVLNYALRNYSIPVRNAVARRVFSTMKPFAPCFQFVDRAVGPNEKDTKEMLSVLGFKSLEELIDNTVPKNIRRPEMNTIEPLSEEEALAKLRGYSKMNKIQKSYIGTGWYNNYMPTVILRNVLENPGWYTGYTPYQAEISQGRLEALLSYQTMISDLTGLPISNASLLDDATAGAEAFKMAHVHCKEKRNKFFVAEDCHPQTIACIKMRAKLQGVQVVVGNPATTDFSTKEYSGCIVQYPNTYGSLQDFSGISDNVHKSGGLFIAASDLLALTVIHPPSEFNVDVCIGSTQRFGNPLGFGGPSAGFMSVKSEHVRKMPGRIIGVSKDSDGEIALRLALQAREQHIRRDKATSNICTAQALMANLSVFYAIYHGPEGLQKIANRVHHMASAFDMGVNSSGFQTDKKPYFDTVTITVPSASEIMKVAENKDILLRKIDNTHVSVSFDETTTSEDLQKLLSVFNCNKGLEELDRTASNEIPSSFKRSGKILDYPVFNDYHSEHLMTRYLHKLESKDLSLNYSMITLGSCTMKLNGTSTMIPITWPEFTEIHPYAPKESTKGYLKMIDDMNKIFCDVTGFKKMSFQPNSGAAGEFAGLLCVRKYLDSIHEEKRNICLLPTSAHGTNPASAHMAGFQVIDVKNKQDGSVDMKDFADKIHQYKDNLGVFMITYPSTYGIFDEDIREMVDMVHAAGAQVYMDGANMNAQVGYTCPGFIGADVCHLNLHKTFGMPHGGGGPGVGAIGVTEHLTPFLPAHPIVPTGGEKGELVAAAPYGSADLLPITWMYMNMLGTQGLKRVTATAILNANYMAKKLSGYYDVMFKGAKGMCGHEFIIDMKPFKQYGITETDIAKRLIDYGFHAPTMSFPVHESLMIEPTESEDKGMLDRMVNALICIRKEIDDIATGKVDKNNNPLKNAPHTARAIASDKWDHPYSRNLAAYPSPEAIDNKFWPAVGRVDNVYGDRHLITTVKGFEK
ncbi:hypothetical protein WA158_004880, partial [Blastocystis sp. Blastoise]